MNVRNRTNVLAVAAAAVFFAGTAQADIVGNQTAATDTSTSYIHVAESGVPFGPHTAGHAGIGVSTYFFGWEVDFKGLANTAIDDSNYTVINSNFTKYWVHDPVTSTSPIHFDLGYFDFISVGDTDLDVWIGTWSKDGTTGGTSNYQAYYIGDNATASISRSDKADFSVIGINQGSSVGITTFDVDFGGNTLGGTLGNGIQIAAIIDPTDASFAGGAVAGTTLGASSGQFYGATASVFAGLADFGAGNVLNTAFGGVEVP